MQSTQALTPSSTGAPDGAGHQSTPENLSTAVPERANPALRSRWSAARTFTQNVPTSRIRGQVDDVRAGAKVTSGGSSDSEANDWHVKPSSVPSGSRAVTTTTPVAKCPSTSRRAAGLTAGALAGPVMTPRLGRPGHPPPGGAECRRPPASDGRASLSMSGPDMPPAPPRGDGAGVSVDQLA